MNENLEMKITIETEIPPPALRTFLEERELRVPVFYDRNTNVVILFNPDVHSRSDILQLIDWLMAR